MSRVFVMSETVKEKHNVDGLATFGKVVFLYGTREKLPSAYNMTEFVKSVSDRLNKYGFDSREDYVAIVGKQIELAMMFYTMGLLAGDVRVLFFDASRVEYVPVAINCDSIPDLEIAR